MKKFLTLLPFLLFIVAFSACDEEVNLKTEHYLSPSIQIVNAHSSTFSDVEVLLKIDKGQGQEIRKCVLQFQDITVLANSVDEVEIDLNADTTTLYSYTYNTDNIYHDYHVKASLLTDKYTYTTPIEVVRSNKTKFDVAVFSNEKYPYATEQIAKYISKGNSLILDIKLSSFYAPTDFTIKLNREISLAHNFDVEKLAGSHSLQFLGQVIIPDTLSEGYYDIYVYIDGLELKCPRGIQFIPGAWSKVCENFPGDQKRFRSHFVKDDILYLFGGETYATVNQYFPVWAYDLKNNTWQRKKNFPNPADVANSSLYPQSLKVNNQAYILLLNAGTFELWSYNDKTDEWTFVTSYPGASSYNITSFAIGDEIFAGGGTFSDFWAYNTAQNTWRQVRDFPGGESQHKGDPTAVDDKGMAYVIGRRNRIWQYNTKLDTWTELTQFHDIFRYYYHLIERDGKLFLMGGNLNRSELVFFNDCWTYDIELDKWELNAFIPEPFAYGVAFKYNSGIYAGLSFIHTSDHNKSIYRIDF